MLLGKIISPYGKKRVRFRAMVSKSGKRLQIIIPASYHQDIMDLGLLGKFVEVEVGEIGSSREYDFGFGT